ncbi:MAG TPA: tetratricopeptide repeat protein [Bryobacteraceae bacterium]|jgi:tetratricopeptide (TPR) repeat protein
MQAESPDVLLVTESKVESQAVLGVFRVAGEPPRPIEIGRRTYFDLGAHHGSRVFFTQAEIGPDGGSATPQTVKNALETLHPRAIIQLVSSPSTRRPESSDPGPQLLSDLETARAQWNGPPIHLYALNGGAPWIVVESDAPDAAAKFLRDALQNIAAFKETPGVPSSLPAQAFFFGREKELETIAGALSLQRRTWGVLIDGPGGIGKTALAIRAGHLASHFDRKIFLSAKVRELTPQGERPLSEFVPPNYLDLLSEIARQAGDSDLAKLPEKDRVSSLTRTLTDTRSLILIDNLETFSEADRSQVYEFLGGLPQGCKAIVTSRRRSDIDARVVRVDRLDMKSALALLDQLARKNRLLAAASMHDRQMLYEFTGGNPLLLGWTAGQLGRPGSQCSTVAEACAFLRGAPADDDPLEYIFGDLLDTFSASETAALAVLTQFHEPIEVRLAAELSAVTIPQAQTALEDLTDRALVVADAAAQRFFLPPLAAKFLGDKRPDAVKSIGERLAERAHRVAVENGDLNFDRFPVLEAEWPIISAALPWLPDADNARLHQTCGALRKFLEFSGRWDDWLRLLTQAEQAANGANGFLAAGRWACDAAWIHYLRDETSALAAAVERAESQWRRPGSGAGPLEFAKAMRLRGLAQQSAGNNEAAASSFREALDLCREADTRGDLIAGVLNHLANLDRQAKRYVEAEVSYREALEKAQKCGHREGIASYTGNLSLLESDQGHWDRAESYARRALELSEEIGRKELIASNSARLARAVARQNRRPEGVPYAKRAVDIFGKLRLARQLAWAQEILAECESA